MALCTQTLRNRVFDEKFIAVLRENTSYEFMFRPDDATISDVEHLLPVTGTRRSPVLPDRLCSKKEEIDLLAKQLRGLPRRHFLFVDRSGEHEHLEALRTLELPYEAAKTAFRDLPKEKRQAYERGCLARPLADLLREAHPSLPIETSVSGPTPVRGRALKVAF